MKSWSFSLFMGDSLRKWSSTACERNAGVIISWNFMSSSNKLRSKRRSKWSLQWTLGNSSIFEQKIIAVFNSNICSQDGRRHQKLLQRQDDLHHWRFGLHGQSTARETAVLLSWSEWDNDTHATETRQNRSRESERVRADTGELVALSGGEPFIGIFVSLLLRLKVFHRICKEKPEMFSKIVPVFGDITSKRLGLNDEQYQRVIGSCNVVFHMAASLKLEATLKPNIEMNLTGTKHVIEVCKQMPFLVSAVHLSTAFCNCDQEVLQEKVYEWPQKPNDLIRCAEWMTEDAMDVMGRKLIEPHPNTYTYTKRMAELLVRDEFENLPICIVRPSIG